MPSQPHTERANERRRARAASNTQKPLDSFLESTTRHTWIIPGLISATAVGLWFLFDPQNEENPFRPFLELSYPIVNQYGDTCYGKGAKDLMFVAFYAAFFTFLRELTMEMVLSPLALKLFPKQKSKRHRFMEQGYELLHFSIAGFYGLVQFHLRDEI